MSRRMAGIILLAISAFLYATRFITAAIWGSGFQTWNTKNFAALLGYVDQGLTSWSIAALVVGLVYLAWAELSKESI